MLLVEHTAPLPPVTAPRHRRAGIRLVPLRSGRSRVVLDDGSVLGYLERVDADGGDVRIRSSRMVGRDRRFAVVGEFSSIDDAVDGLRFG